MISVPESMGRYLAGLLVIAFGIIALLNNFAVTSISLGYVFSLLWPLLIIAAGINFLLNRRDITGIITGLIILAVGLAFLARNTGFFYFSMDNFWKGFWPLIIILIGINIIGVGKHSGRTHFAIMGGLEQKQEGWELKSTEYTALMGGIELDVRKAHFTEKEISLTLTAIMGGINIFVPDDTAITCNGTAILGGVNVKGQESGGIIGNVSTQIGDLKTAPRIIHIQSTCIMGGIDIK